MLRTLVLAALLTVGACAPTGSRFPAAGLDEPAFEALDALPPGVHRCPRGAEAVARSRAKYVEQLCARFDDRRRVERHGPFARYDQFGRTTLAGAYDSGLRDGTWHVYRDDGSLFYELAYERGTLQNLACPEGRVLSGTHNGGSAWCGPYFRAVRDGPLYNFDPATMRFRSLGNYAHGHKHGTWVWWDPGGHVVKVEQWVHGGRYWRWEQRCSHVTSFHIPR